MRFGGWTGMPSLRELNGGKMPRILRNGMVIRIGKFKKRLTCRHFRGIHFHFVLTNVSSG